MMKRYIITLVLIFLLSSLEVFSFGSESERFTQAEREYRNGNYTVAYDDFSSFVKEFPLSDYIPDAQYRRAMCLYRLGKYQEAIELFNRVEKRYRLTRYIDYVNFWRGLSFYALGDYKSAVVNLNKFISILEYDKLVPKARLYLALSHFKLDEKERAEKILKGIISNPGDKSDIPYIGVLLLDVLSKEKKFDEVISYYTSLDGRLNIASLKSEYRSRYYFYLAEAYWQRERFEEAKNVYEKIIDSSPEISSVAIRKLFVLAVRENNLSEMNALTQKAEERFAGNVEILKDFWLRIGIESYKRGNFELAKHFLGRVWKLREKTAVEVALPLYMAEIYLKENRFESAIEVLESYLSNRFVQDKGVDISSVIMRLGDLYLLKKDYKKAEDYYLKFLKDYKDSKWRSDVSYLVAYCYYTEKKYTDAIETLTEVLENKDSRYYVDALKLKAISLKNVGKYREALVFLREYLGQRPDDLKAHLEVAKLAFLVGSYRDSVLEVDGILKRVGGVNSSTEVVALYIGGLSAIARKDYSSALNYFNRVGISSLERYGLYDIYPYIVYYRGWAYYRLGDFKKASDIFSFYSSKFHESEFSELALYMAGWCSFNSGNYRNAVNFFAQLKDSKNKSLNVKALFLKGKSLLNLKDFKRATDVFREIFDTYPDSEFADDALFDYAGTLYELGDIDSAIKAYGEFVARYGDSPLLEEVYYRRGEVYFSAKRYEEAKEAFYEYRTKFPKGKLFDAALYWGGYSAYRLKEYFGAVLLWEKLLAEYGNSPFYADALSKTAEIYMKNGDYKKAHALYEKLIELFPREAKILNVRDKLEELKYLQMGLDKREAELSARIGRLGGAKTSEGREAMLELARIYIMNEKKMDFAYEMLKEIINKKEKASTAKAKYLVGEYYYRKGKLIEAGKIFLEAAFSDPSNRDLMAASIYRAAVMMKLAKKYDDLRALVKRLKENFPSSQWAVSGEKLLKGIE